MSASRVVPGCRVSTRLSGHTPHARCQCLCCIACSLSLACESGSGLLITPRIFSRSFSALLQAPTSKTSLSALNRSLLSCHILAFHPIPRSSRFLPLCLQARSMERLRRLFFRQPTILSLLKPLPRLQLPLREQVPLLHPCWVRLPPHQQ